MASLARPKVFDCSILIILSTYDFRSFNESKVTRPTDAAQSKRDWSLNGIRLGSPTMRM